MELLPNLINYWLEILILVLVWLAFVILASKCQWLKNELSTIKVITEILAIILGGIWVYEIFIYDELVKPNLSPPHVNISSSAEVVGEKDNLYVIQLRSTLKNSSKIKVHIMSYWLDMYGYSINSRHYGEDRNFSSEAINILNTDSSIYKRSYAKDYIRSPVPVIIQIEPLLSENWWLESGEEVSISRTLFISKQYDVAQLVSHAKTAKKKDSICIKWGIVKISGDEENRIRPITYLKNDIQGSCKDTDKLEKFDRELKAHKKLRQKYGLSTTVSRIELPLGH